MDNKLTISYLKTLEKLCAVPGISGNERQTGILKVVLNELKKINPKSFEDKFGNIITVFGNGKKKILIDAHLDEVGFITSKSNGDEIPLFPIGEINPKSVNSLNTFVFSKNIKGKIIVRNNNFLFKPNNISETSNIFAGELISFERYFKIDNNIITAVALDNRVGCAAIIELMRNIKIPKDLSIITVFSTEEEKDCSTVGIIADKYKPDFGIIVDAAYAKPIDIDTDKISIPKLGNGCAIQYLGKNFIVSRSITQKFEELANKNNVRYQPEIPFPDIGRTNFPQLEKVGIKTGIINIPVRYQHTSRSQSSVSDAMETIKLLRAVIDNHSMFTK